MILRNLFMYISIHIEDKIQTEQYMIFTYKDIGTKVITIKSVREQNFMKEHFS